VEVLVCVDVLVELREVLLVVLVLTPLPVKYRAYVAIPAIAAIMMITITAAA